MDGVQVVWGFIIVIVIVIIPIPSALHFSMLLEN